MVALRSQIREPRQSLCSSHLFFNIKREYIISCVVLATPEMVFELAESIRRHLCSFGRSWQGREQNRKGRVSTALAWLHFYNHPVFSVDLQRFMYSIHVHMLHQSSEGELKREWYGCYETKPRECALIFMSLWVWWWYNTCSKFFIPDETQYVGYIPQHWTSAAKTVMLVSPLEKRWDRISACFHGKKYSFFFYLGILSLLTPQCYINYKPSLFGFILWVL